MCSTSVHAPLCSYCPPRIRRSPCATRLLTAEAKEKAGKDAADVVFEGTQKNCLIELIGAQVTRVWV